MIIKSLSRKSGGTGQLFNYLFKYMLNEEKQQAIPEKLKPYMHEALKYENTQAFEKALEELQVLLYHGVTKDHLQTIVPEPKLGTLGKGIYLSNTKAAAKELMSSKVTYRKYVLTKDTKLLDAGKDNVHYGKVWTQVAKESKVYTSLSNIQEKVQSHLLLEGYAGIRMEKQTILFDPKSISELPKNFYKLAKYNAPVEKDLSAKLQHPQFVIRHNVVSRTIPGYVKEFERNESNRIHHRKDAVQVYHTILSFSNKDKAHVTDTVLTEMAKKYIELRGKDNLYVITSHLDKDHIHLHCAMSGTRLNGLSARISRAEFAGIKVKLDAFQRERFPELVHSLPRHGKAKEKEQLADTKNKIRFERTMDKDVLLKVLDEAFSSATSQEHFLSQLTQRGHIPYYRSGKLTGIKFENDRKFRLNRLGYDDKKWQELNDRARQEKTLQELKAIRGGNFRESGRQMPTVQERIEAMASDKFRQATKEIPFTDDRNTQMQAIQELRNSREGQENDMERISGKNDETRYSKEGARSADDKIAEHAIESNEEEDDFPIN